MTLIRRLPDDELIPKAPEGPPPKFGHEMLQLFSFGPNYLNFNNGTP
jgi:hypothetical protein